MFLFFQIIRGVNIFIKINNQTKIRFIIIGIIAILAISMVGAVSAADKTISNTTSGGLKTAIGDVGVGETVYMESGVYSGENNIGIIINKSLTIDGKGNNVVIDAKENSTIFTIDSGVKVTLKNLKIINGYSINSQSTIVNRGTLIVDNCIFSNNQGLGFGGTIHNYGIGSESVSVSGCTFSNNQGNSISGSGTISVSGCTFSNNQGEILSGTGTISVSGCTFSNNKEIFGRSGISSEGTISVSGCTFSNNFAKIIYSYKGTITVTNCIFTNNSDNTYRGMISGSATISVLGCSFSSNQATAIQSSGTLTVKECTFSKNQNSIIESSGILTVINSKFINNHIGGYGGIISYSYLTGKYTLNITGSTFTNNKIIGSSGVISIYSQKASTVYITNTNFNNNLQMLEKRPYGGKYMIAPEYASILLIGKVKVSKNNVKLSPNVPQGTYVYPRLNLSGKFKVNGKKLKNGVFYVKNGKKVSYQLTVSQIGYQKKKKGYAILYFAFHGKQKGIKVSMGTLTYKTGGKFSDYKGGAYIWKIPY